MSICIENEKKTTSLLNKNLVSDTIIYFGGRIEEYKGVDIFINNLKKFTIQIYGKWNEKLLQLKKELELKNNITLLESVIF